MAVWLEFYSLRKHAHHHRRRASPGILNFNSCERVNLDILFVFNTCRKSAELRSKPELQHLKAPAFIKRQGLNMHLCWRFLLHPKASTQKSSVLRKGILFLFALRLVCRKHLRYKLYFAWFSEGDLYSLCKSHKSGLKQTREFSDMLECKSGSKGTFLFCRVS